MHVRGAGATTAISTMPSQARAVTTDYASAADRILRKKKRRNNNNSNSNNNNSNNNNNNNNNNAALTSKFTCNGLGRGGGVLHMHSGVYAFGLGRPPRMRQHRAAGRSLTPGESTGHWQRLMPRQTRTMPLTDRHERRRVMQGAASSTGLYIGRCCAASLCLPSGLCVCDNRNGWLFAWGLCWCMLIRFSIVWLLPFTLLYLLPIGRAVHGFICSPSPFIGGQLTPAELKRKTGVHGNASVGIVSTIILHPAAAIDLMTKLTSLAHNETGVTLPATPVLTEYAVEPPMPTQHHATHSLILILRFLIGDTLSSLLLVMGVDHLHHRHYNPNAPITALIMEQRWQHR